MEFIEQFSALIEDRNVRIALALAAVVLLILIVAFVFRRMTKGGLATKRGRVARLDVLEAIAVDQRRRLVLLRRDNTEHLVLIGGNNDVVVEEGIQRVARQPVAANKPADEQATVAPATAAPVKNDVPRVPLKPVANTPIAPNTAITPSGSKDPQLVEMERKLQDALKRPTAATSAVAANSDQADDDSDASLEAAIADAISADIDLGDEKDKKAS